MMPRMIPHGLPDVFSPSSSPFGVLGQMGTRYSLGTHQGDATPWDDGAAWKDFCGQLAGQRPQRSGRASAESGCRPRS